MKTAFTLFPLGMLLRVKPLLQLSGRTPALPGTVCNQLAIHPLANLLLIVFLLAASQSFLTLQVCSTFLGLTCWIHLT